MERPSDQLVAAYFSPEATLLKQKSSTAFKIGAVFGVAAVLSFGVCAGLIFLSLLGLNPLPGVVTFLLLLAFGLFTVASIPTSWVFTLRSAYLRSELSKHVSERMSAAQR